MKRIVKPFNEICARGSWVIVTLTCAGLLFVNVSSAQADPPYSEGEPDGGFHSWCYLSGFRQDAAADGAMTRLRAQTQVRTAYPGPCGDHTDVRWTQGPVAFMSYGQALCRHYRNGRCDVYRIELNMTAIGTAPRPNEQLTKTTCHELGHTVGVQHYTPPDLPGDDTQQSCLRSGEVHAGWTDTNITQYGDHHRRDHINPLFNY